MAFKFSHTKCFVIPLGGCGEFGMNVFALIISGKLYIMDAGSSFASPEKLGVRCNIPDFDLLIKTFSRIQAYFITHGHEDHIGSLPALVRRYPAPIFATAWTTELLQRKFTEYSAPKKWLQLIKPGRKIKINDVEVEYIAVNHSIPNSCHLFIRTKYANIFHTGDFKIYGDEVNVEHYLEKLKNIGKEGVHLLITDSTNAHREGYCPSEKSLVKPISKVINSAKGLVIITTFSSNFERLKNIATICANENRKILVLGRSLLGSFEIGQKVFQLNWNKDLFITEKEFLKHPRQKLVLLVSGSQGESRAALARIVKGEHPQIFLKPEDLVVFSSRVIPGNEKAVFELLSLIQYQKAKVLTGEDANNIHTSGHGYQEDLLKLIALLRPINYLPVHGSFFHLIANNKNASKLLKNRSNEITIANGNIIEVSDKKISSKETFPCSIEYVDETSSQVLKSNILNERLKIGQFGIVILSGVYSISQKSFTQGPDLISHGVPNKNMIFEERLFHNIQSTLEHTKLADSFATNEKVRRVVRSHFADSIKARPIISVTFFYIA